MKQTAFFSICLIGILSQPALAVDGYKDVKFGASEKEWISKGICSMSRAPDYVSGISMWQCHDFRLAGGMTNAYAYFIDGKFSRLGIDLAWGDMAKVSDGLFEKYGPLSSRSTQEQIAALDSQPNALAYIAFDKDTVYISMGTDGNLNKSAMLVYTDPSFDRLSAEKQQAALADAL